MTASDILSTMVSMEFNPGFSVGEFLQKSISSFSFVSRSNYLIPFLACRLIGGAITAASFAWLQGLPAE